MKSEDFLLAHANSISEGEKYASFTEAEKLLSPNLEHSKKNTAGLSSVT